MKIKTGGSQYKVNGRTHYERNKQKYIQRALDRKEELHWYLVWRKELSGCVDCGIRDGRVLDFDHIGKKSITPSRMWQSGWSIRRIEEELKQCEVRCANCHRIKTHARLVSTGAHHSSKVKVRVQIAYLAR